MIKAKPASVMDGGGHCQSIGVGPQKQDGRLYHPYDNYHQAADGRRGRIETTKAKFVGGI